jgi:hypothetical protein
MLERRYNLDYEGRHRHYLRGVFELRIRQVFRVISFHYVILNEKISRSVAIGCIGWLRDYFIQPFDGLI